MHNVPLETWAEFGGITIMEYFLPLALLLPAGLATLYI